MKSRPEIEVSAPAGSYEALSAAIRAGADSVYFGVGRLNMRARAAANFTIEDLAKIAGICRRHKINSYLTLNTIVYDTELTEMEKICRAAKNANVSAVIASDISVIEYAKSLGLPVHVSVQANVCNVRSLKFYAHYADAIIPARELSLRQVSAMTEAIAKEKLTGPGGKPLKLELFAHGALCVAVSGLCQMSLAVYNHSANRGSCYQNCRRRYKVTDAESGAELEIDNHFVMSPKDICTLPVLDRILDAGVSILKIEGRGRGPEYVNTVVSAYRQTVDDWLEGKFSRETSEARTEELRKVFNRGFWVGGHYLGDKLEAWSGVNGSVSPVIKVHLGKVTKYFPKIGIAEVELLAGELKVGDEILITGNTTGALNVKITELREGDPGTPCTSAPKGAIVSFPAPRKVRQNDAVYILRQREFGDTPPPDTTN